MKLVKIIKILLSGLFLFLAFNVVRITVREKTVFYFLTWLASRPIKNEIYQQTIDQKIFIDKKGGFICEIDTPRKKDIHNLSEGKKDIEKSMTREDLEKDIENRLQQYFNELKIKNGGVE